MTSSKPHPRERAKAVNAAVERQCPEGGFEKWHFSIFEQAVKDIASASARPTDKQAAWKYLSGDLHHLTAIGIDVKWVRWLMDEAELLK